MDEPLALGVAAPAPTRSTWLLRGTGAVLVLAGAVLAAVELGRAGAWGQVLARLGLGAFGWGPLAGAVKGVFEARRAAVAPLALWLLGPAAATWLLGWVLVALGSVPRTDAEPVAAEPPAATHTSPL